MVTLWYVYYGFNYQKILRGRVPGVELVANWFQLW